MFNTLMRASLHHGENQNITLFIDFFKQLHCTANLAINTNNDAFK